MEEKQYLTPERIREAAERISPYIRHTPMLREESMDERLNCRVWLKCEMLQISGSFKLRGAANKILSLSEEERARGIICSSSGNHGIACAMIGKMTGAKVTVSLPEDAPANKAVRIRALGGNVLLGPRSYEKRFRTLQEEIKKHGYILVHAYEDYDVMAGQGTTGLEIMESVPDLDRIVVPIGGGGLIAGVSVIAKSINPDIKITGVQPKASNPYEESRKAGHPVEVKCLPTLADGLVGPKPGIKPYPYVRDYVDELVSVEESDIREAVRLIASEGKLIAEPSSAVGIAAVMSGACRTSPDEKVGFILTSGNWDIDKIGEIYCEKQ